MMKKLYGIGQRPNEIAGNGVLEDIHRYCLGFPHKKTAVVHTAVQNH